MSRSRANAAAVGSRNAPASITITPVFVADLAVEGERMPVYVHVIDHPDGRVLVDTGMTTLHPLLADMEPVAQTVPGYETGAWFGVGVRAGTSEEIIAVIEKAAIALAQEQVVKDRLAQVITQPVVSDRKKFTAFIDDERKKWGALIKDLKLRVE